MLDYIIELKYSKNIIIKNKNKQKIIINKNTNKNSIIYMYIKKSECSMIYLNLNSKIIKIIKGFN
jgi:hypothetical protein